MTLFTTTPPAGEPVTLDQAKAYLRVTASAEDDLIAALALAARQRVEVELGLALVATGFTETFDAAPDGPIVMSRAPLIAVSSVAVAGADGAYVALSAGAWQARFGDRVAEVSPIVGWPTPGVPVGGLRVIYTAGYGDAGTVPAPLKQAILELTAQAFDHRGEPGAAPLSLVEPWLAPYRRIRL